VSVKEKVLEILRDQDRKIAQAKKRIPPEYHDFLVLIEQSKVIANKELKLDAELEKLGVFTYKGRTFVKIATPYMSVDGRLAMFADAHKEAGKTYKITSNLPALAEHMLNTGMRPSPDVPVIVWIDSELYGLLEGESRIFWDQSGAHSTNPLEVAKTSALGRAIAQAGIGLIGTGIASAEEVQSAMAAAGNAGQEPEQKPEAQPGSAPRPAALQEPAKTQPAGRERPQAEKPEARAKKSQTLQSYQAQVVVIGQPVQTEKGWEVKAVDVATEEELTLVGNVCKDLAETVYQVKGQRAQNRVKVGEIKPAAEPQAEAPPQDGQAVTAVIQTAPKKTIRSKNGAAEEVVWCRAKLGDRQVLLTGEPLLDLAEGQTVALVASPTGEKAASGEEIYRVQEVCADASAA
jgi:hypothetical protein